MRTTFTQLALKAKGNSLFSNSAFLMASTLVQAVLGFGFWVVCAHLFSPGHVGLASALISASTFIAYLSLLGFNSSFVGYLPTSRNRDAHISTGLVLVLATAFVLGLGYMAVVGTLSPQMAFVQAHAGYVVAFAVLTALGAANLLTDSIFIAYRASKYNLAVYSVQSLVKLALPLAVVALGAFGIFVASGAAAALALVLSLAVIIRRYHYAPAFVVDWGILRQQWAFTSSSYVANLLNIVPTLVLPTIIVNELGAAAAGYYYLTFMLANLVYAVIYAVSQSLFAEGSYEGADLGQLLRHALTLLGALIVPAAVGLAVVGPVVLGVFGKTYGSQTPMVVLIMALAVPVVCAYVVGGVLLRLLRQTRQMVAVNLVYALVICSLAWAWSHQAGLAGVAWAWLTGNAVAAVLALVFAWLSWNRHRLAVDAGRVV